MALSKLRTAIRTHDPHQTAAALTHATIDSTISRLGISTLEQLDAVESATNRILNERGYHVDVLSISNGTLTVEVTDADRKLLNWDRDVLLAELNEQFPTLRFDRVHCHRKPG